MTALEVILILVGVAFVLVSFFVEEKLTKKDIDRIASLSENELRVIVERQLKSAEGLVEESIEGAIEDAMVVTKRAVEKVTNEKMIAINEYSDTVIESMNKTHNEILFLYNMLNDKHVELTTLAGQLDDFSKRMKSSQSQMLDDMAVAAKELENSVPKQPPVPEEPYAQEAYGPGTEGGPEEPVPEPDGSNHNDRILALHREGVSDVEIARRLGLGLGEVRLVIGLYRGDGK